MKKIIITGGHLTPALALLENLEAKKSYQVYFFGRKYATEGGSNFSAEYELLKKTQVEFVNITTGRLQRKFTRYTILSLAKIPIGFIQSLFYLAKIRPTIIISFGGYLSSPVVFAGWLLGIDSITHEQAAIPGLATKINSLFSKKVFLTWYQSQKYFYTLSRHSDPEPARTEFIECVEGEESKFEVVGNLTRQAIFKKTAKDAKINNLIEGRGKIIFVTGGSLGSHFLNDLLFGLIDKLDDYKIIHQVGTTNYRGDLDRAHKIKRSNYLAQDYIDSDNIGAVINGADLIISRSGANTIWDLGILAKVAICVPLPISAGGEQQENAKILELAGMARILDQDKCTQDKLVQEINYVFKHYASFQKNAKNFAKTLPLDTADKVVKYIK